MKPKKHLFKRYAPSVAAWLIILWVLLTFYFCLTETIPGAGGIDRTPGNTGTYIALVPDEETAAPVSVVYYRYDCPLELTLQQYIQDMCKDYGIDPALIIAIIDRESDFRAGAIGDGGQSYGLMQLKLEYQEKLMDRLSCTDLLDPYQNIRVGIDCLAGKIRDNGTVEKGLVAYNCGQTGAEEKVFSQGRTWTEYSRDVLSMAKEYTRGAMPYLMEVCDGQI